VYRVVATHFIRQFPVNFPYRASPCAITFQLDSTICEIVWCHGSSHKKVVFNLFTLNL